MSNPGAIRSRSGEFYRLDPKRPQDKHHHTDRDCRYASDDYRAELDWHGIVASMSRKADCWDNAVAESFFATLEKELLDDEDFMTPYHGRTVVVDYIENYYNNRRRHSYLDYVSPFEYETVSVVV